MAKSPEKPPQGETEDQRRERVLKERAAEVARRREEIENKVRQKSKEELEKVYTEEDVPDPYRVFLGPLREAYPDGVPQAIFNQFVVRSHAIDKDLKAHQIKLVRASDLMKEFLRKVDVKGKLPDIENGMRPVKMSAGRQESSQPAAPPAQQPDAVPAETLAPEAPLPPEVAAEVAKADEVLHDLESHLDPSKKLSSEEVHEIEDEVQAQIDERIEVLREGKIDHVDLDPTEQAPASEHQVFVSDSPALAAEKPEETSSVISSDEILAKIEDGERRSSEANAVSVKPPLEKSYRKERKPDERKTMTKRRARDVEMLPIPDVIRSIYGEKFPLDIEDMVVTYTKMSGKKREEYLEYLRKNKAEMEAKKKTRPQSEEIKLKTPWGSLGVYTELKKLEKEFEDIYPNGVPNDVLEKYRALRAGQVESFAASVPEQRKVALEAQTFIEEQRALHNKQKVEEAKEFDPHSVQSMVSVDEQKRNEEMRGLLAKAGKLSQDLVRDPNLDITEAKNPFHTEETEEHLKSNQEEMDAFAETPKDMRAQLKSAVEQLTNLEKEKLATPEEGRKFEKATEYLAKRKTFFDGEKWAKKIGEGYNKMPLKWKIATGALLTVGLGVSLPFSTMATAAFGGAIAAQRAAGMFGTFVNLEKHLQAVGSGHGRFAQADWYKKLMTGSPEKQNNIAAAMAMAWTFGLGAGMTYVAKEIGEHVQAFLKDHYPLTDGGTKVSSGRMPGTMFANEMPAPSSSPTPPASIPADVLQSAPIEAVEVPAVAETGVAPVIPEISVTASSGHGYEWMAKRVWEQLQEKGLEAGQYPEGSDMRSLLEADAQSIDRVVHRIAADPAHGFFRPDGSSVRIDLGSTMTINADGNLQLGEAVMAPDNAAETPPYPPASEASITESAESGGEEPEASDDQVPVSEEPEPSTTVPDEPPKPFDSVESEEAISGASSGVTETPPSPPESSVTPPQNASEIPVPQPPAEVPLTPEQTQSITNEFGVVVPLNEPHLYADAEASRFFVYGGSPAEQAEMIAKHLAENPDKVVFSTDDSGVYRIPWHLLEGKVTPGTPMRTSGFFGFFSTWMEPPSPNEFAKLIK